MNKIVIPETSEYGWILSDKGSTRFFKPTKKNIWSRISFIVRECGGTIERITTGFNVHGASLTEEAKQMIQEELLRMKGDDPGLNVTTSIEGREEPDLDSDNHLIIE